MNPQFKIIADGANITQQIQQRLISLKTTDESGLKSDTLIIDIDDRDGQLELPRHGAKLSVSLGYTQTGLVKIGDYFVDETSVAGWPQTMTISAKAADLTGGEAGDIKSSITRSFDNIRFGELVTTIAGEVGMTGKISASLSDILFTHLDQTEESNLHLLTRLAESHNGVAKVTNDLLIVAKALEAKSMSGVSLSHIIINKVQVSDYRASLTDRDAYASVTATWHDKKTAKLYTVQTSTAKPAFIIRHTYESEESAVRAAKNKMESLNQGTNTVDVSLSLGNPNLFAESPLILVGFRTGVSDTTWVCTRVEHTFSNAGFRTSLTGESKKN
jgi:phage protein D